MYSGIFYSVRVTTYGVVLIALGAANPLSWFFRLSAVDHQIRCIRSQRRRWQSIDRHFLHDFFDEFVCVVDYYSKLSTFSKAKSRLQGFAETCNKRSFNIVFRCTCELPKPWSWALKRRPAEKKKLTQRQAQTIFSLSPKNACRNRRIR